jgi:hypothetical protein
MPEYKCPFSMVQASGACGCSNAREVVRRGGSEYDCVDANAHAACSSLVEYLNRVAFPALGYEDDLNLTPKSVYERIMLGGLQGLRMSLDPGDVTPETRDIHDVVEKLQSRYDSIADIPAAEFLGAIEKFQHKKRRRKSR